MYKNVAHDITNANMYMTRSMIATLLFGITLSFILAIRNINPYNVPVTIEGMTIPKQQRSGKYVNPDISIVYRSSFLANPFQIPLYQLCGDCHLLIFDN